MPEETPPVVLRLLSPGTTPKGVSLCLKSGDLITALNGAPLHFEGAEIAAAITEAKGNPVALTVQRGGKGYNVLTDSARLGPWEPLAAVADAGTARINPDVLRNWEILRGPGGIYDIQPLSPSPLALLLPPLWLLQMRLWIPGAALIAAGMVAAAVSPLMFIAVYLTAGLHIWHTGTRYFRKDRLGRGMSPVMVLAAPSERAAHATYARFEPAGRFVFAPPPPAPSPPAPGKPEVSAAQEPPRPLTGEDFPGQI